MPSEVSAAAKADRRTARLRYRVGVKKHQLVEVGSVVYQLEAMMGQGGAAEVWKARSNADNAPYALKRIPKDPKRATRNHRFRHEISYGMATRHPNVVKILSHAEDDEAFLYVMDLYPMTLENIIATESDFEVLLDYAIQLCDGLAHIQGEDVVHRDIKPQNILIDPAARRAVLADFGIARFKNARITKRGELLANRNYLAPEQMARGNPDSIDKPADIFALGLVINELFTKRNPRGLRPTLIGDIFPFLSDIDLLTQRMMLQHETERIGIDAARDSLVILRAQLRQLIDELSHELRPTKKIRRQYKSEYPDLLRRAAGDVLSAKYIFERTQKNELERYDFNYHCEISYSLNAELLNTCMLSRIYRECKRKFDSESIRTWEMSGKDGLSTADKARLQVEFESILDKYPVSRWSRWAGLARRAAQLFRFCQAYHCDEILGAVRRETSSADPISAGLSDAPILWLVQHVRDILDTGYIELDQLTLEDLEFERQVSVRWKASLPVAPDRVALGASLLMPTADADEVDGLLRILAQRWDISAGERTDSKFSVHFRSRQAYEQFRDEAMNVASPYYAFEGDVIDLLRPVAIHDDLVALVWDRDNDIRSTLAKILGKRRIFESRRR